MGNCGSPPPQHPPWATRGNVQSAPRRRNPPSQMRRRNPRQTRRNVVRPGQELNRRQVRQYKARQMRDPNYLLKKRLGRIGGGKKKRTRNARTRHKRKRTKL